MPSTGGVGRRGPIVATPAASGGPVVTIRPAGPLSGVRTIEAIRCLRLSTTLSLVEAKRTVEAMVLHGESEVDLGWARGRLGEPAARDMARRACRDLREQGVEVLLEGIPLTDWIEGVEAGPAMPGP